MPANEGYKTVRALHVGYGVIARGMLRVLRTLPWYQTAGIVDLRDEALGAAAQNENIHPGALYKDLAAALRTSGANVAFINTPSELHFAQAHAVLEAGVTPVVAKPITQNYEDAVELVARAAALGIPLAVGQQVRYLRHFRALRRFMEAGRLGNVEALFLLNSKPRPDPLNLGKMAQPTLYENACHHFDCLSALFPAAVPEWIVCDGFRPSWSRYAGPCMVNALIGYSPAPRVLYHGGFSSQAEMYELRLEGTRGALRCRGVHMSNDTMAYEFADSGGKFNPCALDAEDPVVNPWQEFFSVWHTYLNGGPEPPFSGRNNLRVLALLCAGVESVESGQRVKVAMHPRFKAAFD